MKSTIRETNNDKSVLTTPILTLNIAVAELNTTISEISTK